MDTKHLLTSILLFLSLSCYAQDKKIFFSAIAISKDSVLLQVGNTTASDTFQFSIYKQQWIGKTWVTNDYDVFCDLSNPNTTILMITPSEHIKEVVALGNIVYSSEIKQVGTLKNKKASYRYLVRAWIKGKPAKIFKIYSNNL